MLGCGLYLLILIVSIIADTITIDVKVKMLKIEELQKHTSLSYRRDDSITCPVASEKVLLQS